MGRVNGETVAGTALTFLALLFISAGMVNPVWAVALPADAVLLAVGIAVIGLGFWTANNEKKHPQVEHQH